MEHLHTPEVAIKEIARVLAPGGRLILTTRFVYPLHDIPHDYFRYTKYGLRHLFKDWKIKELTEDTDTFSTVAVLLQRIGFQTKLRGGKFSKAIIYSLAWILERMKWLVVEEYGDIKKQTSEKNIMSAGYMLVAELPK